MTTKRPDRIRQANAAISTLMDTGVAWASKLRLKAFLWVLAIALAAWATVVLTSIAWVPVVGVAAVAAAVSINRLAERLSHPTCLHCGSDLSGRPLGDHGVVCHQCGSLHMPRPSGSAPAPAGPEFVGLDEPGVEQPTPDASTKA